MKDLYFPGERKRLFWSNVRSILWTLFISAFIFTGLGYTWHYHQVTNRHIEELNRLEGKIAYYRSYWTPIRQEK